MSASFTPLGASRLDAEQAWRFSSGQLAWAFVALGTLVRLLRYLAGIPLWFDECFLAENFLDRSYSDLLGPLINDQVAPIGFLWIELTAVKLFGFSEWSLRLFPLCCGIASLFLFRHLASRILTGSAYVLAVACLSVAKAPIFLSTDAKPYASDLLVALAILTLAVEWLRAPQRARWLWALAAFVPLALVLSMPAIFVLGGVSLALAVPAWQARSSSARWVWLALNQLLAACFLLLVQFNLSRQYESTREFMLNYWTKSDAFPPLADAWALAVWLVDKHSGEDLFAYPYGAENGGSTLTVVCVLVAAVVMWRQGQRRLLTAFASMLGLLFVAAVLRCYPYGGNIRLVQFLAPAVCLMAGLGGAVLLERLSTATSRRLAISGVLTGLGIFACGMAADSFARPYRDAEDPLYKELAKSLWADESDYVTVCAKTDLALDFCDPRGYQYPYAVYRCYQRLYSRGHEAGPSDEATGFAELRQPTRLLIHKPPHLALDRDRVDDWLQQFENDFEISGPETLAVDTRKTTDMYGAIEVYRLQPRGAVRTASAESSDGRVR